MGRKKKFEDWPVFRQTRRGVSLVSGPWKAIETSGLDEYSEAVVKLAGHQPGGEADYGQDTVLGMIRLTRTRHNVNGRMLLARSFRLSFKAVNEKIPVRVGGGHCRTWEEAVEALTACTDVVAAVAEHGKKIYDPSRWVAVRPFRVRWPWEDAREPNHQYSEFQLAGDWRLEDGVDTLIAYSFSPSPADTASLARRVGANAFLAPHPECERLTYVVNGEVREATPNRWVIYHKNNMREYDEITLEEFHARLIAGSGEDD